MQAHRAAQPWLVFPRAEDMQRAQRLIQEVSALELHHEAGELAAVEGMVRRDLTLAGQPWSLYHDATRAGMVFGIAVPQTEIDGVLAPMRGVNLQLLIGIGLVLLLHAGVVLFLVAGLLRQLRTLLSSANIALKQARGEQRPYAFYDPTTRVRRDYERKLAWANRLTEALDDGRVVAYFQTLLEVARDRVGKFECLVRMLDEEGSPVSPGVFLEVARRSRLYRRLTLTMIDRCLTALAESPHEFSLNLSGEDIVDAEISEALLARVAESGVGGRLIFEILESEGIDNYSRGLAFTGDAAPR